MATATFIDEVARHLKRALEERRSSYAEHGRSLEEIGPPEELARRMAGVVPEPSRWDDVLGPFYTTSKVAEILGGELGWDEDRRSRSVFEFLGSARREYGVPA